MSRNDTLPFAAVSICIMTRRLIRGPTTSSTASPTPSIQLADQARDGGLAGAGIALKDEAERQGSDGEAAFLAALVGVDEVEQAADLGLHLVESDQAIQLFEESGHAVGRAGSFALAIAAARGEFMLTAADIIERCPDPGGFRSWPCSSAW